MLKRIRILRSINHKCSAGLGISVFLHAHAIPVIVTIYRDPLINVSLNAWSIVGLIDV